MTRNRFWLLGTLLVGLAGGASGCEQAFENDSAINIEEENKLPENLDLKAEQIQDSVTVKGTLTCGQTVKGGFVADSNIHGYKFTGYAGKKYTVSFKAGYASANGVVIGIYDEETAKRVAYTRKNTGNQVTISYTAENYTGYQMVIAPRKVDATGLYTFTFSCSGTELAMCYDSSTCQSGEYCAYLSGCGKTSRGLCRKKPTTCSGTTDWVCGCDGNNYINECECKKQGVSVFAKGKCASGVGSNNASSSDVTLVAEKKAYAYMDEIKLTFSNRMKNEVFLPGCSVFYWEKLVGNSWTVDGPDKNCTSEGIAQVVKPSGDFVDSIVAKKLGTWRMLVTYGADCTYDQPLSRAKCAQIYSVRSSQFTIKDCPTVAVPSCPGGAAPIPNYDYEGVCITSYTCPADPNCYPTCMKIGTTYEGWYDSCTKQIINDYQGYPAWDDCAKCKAICKYADTMNEGWYSSCNGYVISYCDCD